MTQSAREFERALESYEPIPLGAKRAYRWHCPRCQRGVSNPKLLQRPFYREHGPFLCSTCISWEQKWERIEEGRRDRDEHLRGKK
jgi:hypothetical protein